MIKDFITIAQTAEKWNVTERQVQNLCSKGQIQGAVKFGRMWAIPKESPKPIDNRITTGDYRNWRRKDK